MAKPKTIWLVVQEGGSTGEWYPGTYNSRVVACRAIACHKKASYNAIGPYKINPTLTKALTVKIKLSRGTGDAECEMIELLRQVCADVALKNFA